MTNVLLIDDQPNYRRQMRRLLERAGLDVIADVGDITSAENFLQTMEPDLAIVDVLLGDTSGIKGTKRLKQLAPNMRVILISAYHDDHLKKTATAVGAEAFIPKDELNLSIVSSWDKNKEKK